MGRGGGGKKNVPVILYRSWVVPEKIHNPPPPHGGHFCCLKGEGGKMSQDVRRGGEEKCLRMSKGGGKEMRI